MDPSQVAALLPTAPPGALPPPPREAATARGVAGVAGGHVEALVSGCLAESGGTFALLCDLGPVTSPLWAGVSSPVQMVGLIEVAARPSLLLSGAVDAQACCDQASPTPLWSSQVSPAPGRCHLWSHMGIRAPSPGLLGLPRGSREGCTLDLQAQSCPLHASLYPTSTAASPHPHSAGLLGP